MKVKVDFVTNSSSESFGVVAIDTAATIVATGGLTIMVNAARDLILGGAAEAAQEVAEAVRKDAEWQEQAVKEGYSEAERMIDSERRELERELAEFRQMWNESDKTADKDDPGYARLRQQAEEYEEYLKQAIEFKNYEEYVIQKEKAEAQAALEAKDEWNRQRQVDLIAAKEEKALLQATLKGYGAAGMDVKGIADRLAQLERREAELTQVLKENDALIDYTPRDRGVIGPSPETLKMMEDQKKRKAEMEKAQAISDAKKRAEIEERIRKAEQEQLETAKSASRWDFITKAAEGVQFGADVLVEGLSYITGPAGKKVKLAYDAGKNVASGLGEGMADPKNAGKHLAKGFAGAATEVAKSRFKDGKLSSNFKSALADMANGATQSGLDAAIGGGDLSDALQAGMQGMGSAAVDSLVDHGLDKVKSALPKSVTSKLPFSTGTTVDVSDFTPSQILNNNPLSSGLTRIVGREGAASFGKDAIKGPITDLVNKPLGFANPN